MLDKHGGPLLYDTFYSMLYMHNLDGKRSGNSEGYNFSGGVYRYEEDDDKFTRKISSPGKKNRGSRIRNSNLKKQRQKWKLFDGNNDGTRKLGDPKNETWPVTGLFLFPHVQWPER